MKKGDRQKIEPRERDLAEEAAVKSMRAMLGYEAGYINPRVGLGNMSEHEIAKIAQAAVSGWQVERSRQLVGDRIFDEAEFAATGEIPEPFELGPCSFALNGLGDLIEKMGLTDKPIGTWCKDDILIFVWTAWDLVQRAHTIRDERPGPSPVEEEVLMMRAG